MEGWKVGKTEGWKYGKMQGWKDGSIEGRIESWKIGDLSRYVGL
jgi:hypothetical protein